LLFGVLHGVLTTFDVTMDKLGETRLRVMSRTNVFETMPISYEARIARVPGVRATSHIAIFIGYYQDPKNGFNIAALDVDSFLDAIPQLRVPADQREAMRTTRTGAIVGYELAKKFNWRIGDRITLHSINWIDAQGSSEWPLDIVAFCNAGPDDDPEFANELYMNYEYLDTGRANGKGTVHQFVVSIDDHSRSSDIALAIDALFANSSSQTITVNEREWMTNNLRQIGNLQLFVNTIIGAVLFTLLFLAGNTMSQSVSERTSELGVLKALGFRNTGVCVLVIAEAAVLSVIGAALGLGATALMFPGIFKSLGGSWGPTPLPLEVYLVGFAIALLLAAVCATIPAMRARRLTVSEALSGH
jgi:putative ABC transport system permease protein